MLYDYFILYIHLIFQINSIVSVNIFLGCSRIVAS